MVLSKAADSSERSRECTASFNRPQPHILLTYGLDRSQSVLLQAWSSQALPGAPHTQLCLQSGSTEADSKSLACRVVTSGSPEAQHPRKEGKESRMWQKKLSHDADP